MSDSNFFRGSRPSTRRSAGRPSASGQGTALLAGAFGAAFIAVPAHADEQRNPDIVVTGQRPDVNVNAEPEAPYKAESSDGKFTDSVLDTPKSQTVITKEVIEDIGATSFREINSVTFSNSSSSHPTTEPPGANDAPLNPFLMYLQQVTRCHVIGRGRQPRCDIMYAQ